MSFFDPLTIAKEQVFGRSTLSILSGTADADDVLYGKTFYNTSPYTLVTGTLALTGTASPDDVAIEKTFYNTDPKTKLTGILHPRKGTFMLKEVIKEVPTNVEKQALETVKVFLERELKLMEQNQMRKEE